MSTQEEGTADRNERNHEGNNNHWVNSIVLSKYKIYEEKGSEDS